MDFIDVTGHVFSLPSYDDKPLHLKYKEGDYVFWLKDQEISINNYYILPIRMIINVNDILFKYDNQKIENPFILNISLESNFYKLLGPKYIQERIENNTSIKQNIEIDFEDAKSELTIEDFYFDSDNQNNNLIVESGTEKYYLFPFYVIGKCDIEGTILSNIMIHTIYKSEHIENKQVWYTRDQLYDYFVKKTMTDIKVYELNPETEQESLYTVIRTGYNPYTEILYPYFGEGVNPDDLVGANKYSTNIHSSLDDKDIEAEKDNHWYRIRNWGGGMASDVYHYIYNLPEDVWLKPNHIYRFEGEVFQSCKYCGSIVWVNHEGGSGSYPQSLLKHNGVPYYPEEYEYDEITNTYTWQESKFPLTNISGISETHASGKGFKFKNDYFVVPQNVYIRDIFFDVDNAALVNNTNGGYLEIKELRDIDSYTQITVGGTFIDEQEELIINGKNMGIHLPKEIIRSIYDSSFYHKYPNEKLLKDKMKELLLNYMSIKGECGNFKSVYNSLKWFGWADKVEISKLIKTDNEFQNQFILDYFSINTDIKDVYRFFNPTNMISLSVKGNTEDGFNQQNYNNSLIGEGKPIMKDLFNEVVEVKDQGISFYKPYYNFMFNELALKLDCLKYYYQTYFLPIHIKINRASIDYKVYANTVKMTAIGFEKQTEAPVYVPDNSIKVVFPEEHTLLYYKSEHYIDSMFNEFSNYNRSYNNDNNDLYYVNENCIFIPITFKDLSNTYTKDDEGEYLLINGKYIKPYLFVDDNGKKVSPKYATYYILNPGDVGEKIEFNIERYTKISNKYFNVKIFLTYTVKKQSDTGHYVYKDGEYLYKETFYNDYGIEDESGSYTYFWGNKELGNKLEYVPNKDRYDMITENLLDFEDSFNFYQSLNCYYSNFIIIPRLINKKNIDWLNTDFRMSVLVNNTWFTYDFKVNIPDLYLEFGRLKYRYFIDNEFTLFDQIETLDDNHITFNSFMYQPDFVNINTLFYNESSNSGQTFLEKLQEIIEGDQTTYTMRDFYNDYYRRKITIPYNKKFYNRIHLFDVYKTSLFNESNAVLYDESIAIQWFSSPIYANYLNSGYNKFVYILKEAGYDIDNDDPPKRYISAVEIENNIHQLTQEEKSLISGGTAAEEYVYDENKPMQIEYCYSGHSMYEDRPSYMMKLLSCIIKNTEGEIIYHYRLSDEDREFYLNHWSDNLKLKQLDGSYSQYDLEGEKIYQRGEGLLNYNMLGTEEPTKLLYDGNPKNIELYQSFFEYNETSKRYILKAHINEDAAYDAYLMHDPIVEGRKAYWYVVFISKYPIGDYIHEEELDINTPTYRIIEKKNGVEINSPYLINYYGNSIDKFLVNRMDIEKSNGYNHFNQDDLVIVTVKNNDYHFNIDLTNKWDINLIYDYTKSNKVMSNSNIVIIPNNNYDHLYTPGYYNVLLNYSINGLNDHQYLTKGYYRINKTTEETIYPEIQEIIEEETYDINYVISDFSVIYENIDGKRIITREILDPDKGYQPFAIKILNKKYFDPEQEWSIYMGLKALDCNHPDSGFSDQGREGIKTPWWGFNGTDIPELKTYEYICYGDETQTIQYDGDTYVYFPSDNAPKNEDGTFKWPVGNDGRRGYVAAPENSTNILNKDDTINWNFINKETHAAGDWNGYENTQKIIAAFNCSEMSDWRTIDVFPQGTIGVLEPNMLFSPAAACAWRYHTLTTEQGDWYLPSYGELIFITYNFQKLTDKFNEIKAKYPNCCKADLFTGLNSNAIWSSTEQSQYQAWELHPSKHAHSLSKTTSSWWAVPYIRINDKTLTVWGKEETVINSE